MDAGLGIFSRRVYIYVGPELWALHYRKTKLLLMFERRHADKNALKLILLTFSVYTAA